MSRRPREQLITIITHCVLDFAVVADAKIIFITKQIANRHVLPRRLRCLPAPVVIDDARTKYESDDYYTWASLEVFQTGERNVIQGASDRVRRLVSTTFGAFLKSDFRDTNKNVRVFRVYARTMHTTHHDFWSWFPSNRFADTPTRR